MDAQSTPPPLIASEELEKVRRFLLRTLARWRVAAAVAVGVVALSGVTYLVWPREYRSEAVVYYQEGMQWTAAEGVSGRRAGQRLRDVLLARARLTEVIQGEKLYPRLVAAGELGEAVERMRLAVSFRVAEGDVFVLSYTGASPEEAQRVTKRLTDVLVAENQRLKTEQAELARSFLESERKRTETELSQREAAQLRFLAKNPEFAHDEAARGGPLGSQAAPTAAVIVEDPGLAALRREQERLRRQLSTPSQAGRSPQDPAVMAALNEAETTLRNAERELARRRTLFTEEHPDLRAAEAQLKLAQEAYRRAAADAQAAQPELARDRLEEIQREISVYRRTAAARGRGFEAGATSEAAERVVGREAEWARLSREVTESRERFREIETRQFMASMTANLTAAGQSAQIVVIDPAFLPASPLGPTRSRVALMALALAFFAGALAALLANLLDDRILDRLDLERLELGPVLAEIPGFPASGGAPADGARARVRADAPPPPSVPFVKVHRVAPSGPLDSRLVMLAAPDSPAAAGFRVLRHRLTERGVMGTILVASAEAGEGRSFCAANLALALGEAGRARVLLLEANLRTPSLARMLGFDPPACVSKQLERRTERAEQPWVVVENLAPWLHTAAVAPGTQVRPIVDGPAVLRCVAELRLAGYDHIVIDSPPVLGSSDVNVIEEGVDGVLMTVRIGTSHGRALRAAVEQAGKKSLLGFALVGA